MKKSEKKNAKGWYQVSYKNIEGPKICKYKLFFYQKGMSDLWQTLAET